MKVKLLIVEDEVLVAEDLKDDLIKSGFEVVGTAISDDEALDIIEKKQPDLVLMDIQIKGKLDGIELAQEINELTAVPIIYISANTGSQFINRALETRPHAFLTKPYNLKDLVISIELAMHKYNESVLVEEQSFFDSIFVKSGSYYRKIKIEDILYIEADGSYCQVYTKSGKHILSFNLNHFQQEVKSSGLKRVHRSYVVNTEQVDGFDKSSLLIGGKMIPVSQNRKEDVFRLFKRL
jgi:DNA-binding LytR/AlgR family response regulator